MDERERHEGANEHVYRVAGALTITRAATTQREIDALPDPLTIDLSEIERMDTVGAWIVYRSVRDRKAKVIGASRDEVSLLKEVGEFDKPATIEALRNLRFLPGKLAGQSVAVWMELPIEW